MVENGLIEVEYKYQVSTWFHSVTYSRQDLDLEYNISPPHP